MSTILNENLLLAIPLAPLAGCLIAGLFGKAVGRERALGHDPRRCDLVRSVDDGVLPGAGRRELQRDRLRMDVHRQDRSSKSASSSIRSRP